MNPGMYPGAALGGVQSLVAPQVPKAPGMGPYALPQAPVSRRRPRVNMFDREHLSDTLFALGTGMMQGSNFGESLANAAGSLREARAGYLAEETPHTEIGGPDNSFEITTDPVTGERSYRQIPEFAKRAEEERRRQQAPNVRDRVTLRGQVMSSILRAPVEQRAALYQQFLQDSASLYGDLGLPATWDDATAQVMADQAITPEARMTAEARDRAQDYREMSGDRNYRFKESQAAARASRPAGRRAPPSTRRAPAGITWDD